MQTMSEILYAGPRVFHEMIIALQSGRGTLEKVSCLFFCETVGYWFSLNSFKISITERTIDICEFLKIVTVNYENHVFSH